MSRYLCTAAIMMLVPAMTGSLAAASAGHGATVIRETARSGVWFASFTYVETAKPGYLTSYTELHLTVLRGSTLLLDAPVSSSLPYTDHLQPGGFGSRPSVSFDELDGDAVPELLVALYTGGAHCCFVEQVFDLAAVHPRKHEINFADGGARLINIGGQGLFRSSDDSFAYVFTDFADSGFPIRLWSYSRSGFSNVTREYPGLVTTDAAYWWMQYRKELPAKRDERGILAAWAADEAILHRASVAKERLLQIAFSGVLDRGFGGAKGSTYVRQLWRFLARHGYLG